MSGKGSEWGAVAEWYDRYLEKGEDTYQRRVILPNILRLLNLRDGQRLLDLACGQGFFAREFAKAGASVIGVDTSETLIAIARKRGGDGIVYQLCRAERLTPIRDYSVDIVTCVLAIENIERIQEAFSEVARVLRDGGRLYIVMNHPAFRLPKKSRWLWDEELRLLYRRIDGYLRESKALIEMHPGQDPTLKTTTYHRPLQFYFKALSKAGFVVRRLEEWISHKQSTAGPRAVAENRARREFPLFLMLECVKMSNRALV